MAGGCPGKEIGDGEQKFLKGWVEKEKTRGMVDMVAFRFGDYTEELKDLNSTIAGKWGEGQGGYWFWGNSTKVSTTAATSTSALQKNNLKGPGLVMSQDGCIFPGTGALETHSVGDISTYISELYQHGDEASARSSGGRKQKKHRMKPKELLKPKNTANSGGNNSTEGLSRRSNSITTPTKEEPGATAVPPPPPSPPPLPPESKLKPTVTADVAEGSGDARGRVTEVTAGGFSKSRSSSNTNAKILNLLTFGWSGGSTKSSQTRSDQTGSTNAATTSLPEPEGIPPPMVNLEPMAESVDEPRIAQTELGDNQKNKMARFAIGFLGDLYADDLDDDLKNEHSSGRITSRTVWAERRQKLDDSSRKDLAVVDGSGQNKRRNSEAPTIKRPRSMNLEEFRIVVYTVSRFTLLNNMLQILTTLSSESPTHIRIHIRNLRPTTNLSRLLPHSPSPALPPPWTPPQIPKARQHRLCQPHLPPPPPPVRHPLQSLHTHDPLNRPAYTRAWIKPRVSEWLDKGRCVSCTHVDPRDSQRNHE